MTAAIKSASDAKLNLEMLQLQNAYLLRMLHKTSVTQYVSKDIIEQNQGAEAGVALAMVANYVESVQEVRRAHTKTLSR